MLKISKLRTDSFIFLLQGRVCEESLAQDEEKPGSDLLYIKLG